jgi:hypothetical protein
MGSCKLSCIFSKSIKIKTFFDVINLSLRFEMDFGLLIS